MTTDLRELLKEARDELNATLDIQVSPELKRLVERIDAALSEPAPEPVAWMMYDEGKRIPLICHLEPSNRHFVDAFQVYRAPPPASPSDVRDAARYKWLAYIGDSSWTPLCKRDNGPGGQLFEQYIDAAYERFRKSQQGTAI